MNTCIKVSKQSTPFGLSYKVECTRPEFKNGLCSHHYKRSIEKSLPWGERPNYRPATQDDLDSQRSLKLKTSNQNQLYKYIKGEIRLYSSKRHRYEPVPINPDPELFCVTC